jgi:hypothetical protein
MAALKIVRAERDVVAVNTLRRACQFRPRRTGRAILRECRFQSRLIMAALVKRKENSGAKFRLEKLSRARP